MFLTVPLPLPGSAAPLRHAAVRLAVLGRTLLLATLLLMPVALGATLLLPLLLLVAFLAALLLATLLFVPLRLGAALLLVPVALGATLLFAQALLTALLLAAILGVLLLAALLGARLILGCAVHAILAQLRGFLAEHDPALLMAGVPAAVHQVRRAPSVIRVRIVLDARWHHGHVLRRVHVFVFARILGDHFAPRMRHTTGQARGEPEAQTGRP